VTLYRIIPLLLTGSFVENLDCMNWEELSKYHKDLTGLTKESLGDEPRKGITSIRFPGALPIKSVYSLPQALVGIKKWTDLDIIFERNKLIKLDHGTTDQMD
jgi:hypothetical protein